MNPNFHLFDRVKAMRSANIEMIDKLRIAALKKCEERVSRAVGKKDVLLHKLDYTIPQYGVSSVLKHKHGLV